MKKIFAIILILCVLATFVGCNPDGSVGGNPFHDHKYTTTYKSDSMDHWFECSCGARKNIMKHTFGEPVYNTTTHEYISTCSVCNARAYLNSHQLDVEYTYDDVGHWKACDGCDLKVYYAEHTLSEPILDPETNQFVRSCMNCPYESHTVAHVFGSEYHMDEFGHWRECVECGEPGQVYAHTFGDRRPGDDPCSSVYKCILCGYTTGIIYEHTWDWTQGVLHEVTDETGKVVGAQTVYTCTVEGCGETMTSDGLPNIPTDIVTKYPYEGIAPGGIAPEDYVNKQYYSYKLSMDKNADNRLILRKTLKTFYDPNIINDPSLEPTNRTDFKYIASLIPTEIYETEYKFTLSQVPRISFGTAEFNANDFNQKFFNFIRFVYISTNGGLLLSFEYDTSFIYQTPNLCFAIRGRFVVEECSLNSAYDTLSGFLQRDYAGPFNYAEYFAAYSQTIFAVRYLGFDDSTRGIQVGDYTWCDVNIEIPLLQSSRDDAFWEYVIANNKEGIQDGLYNW